MPIHVVVRHGLLTAGTLDIESTRDPTIAEIRVAAPRGALGVLLGHPVVLKLDLGHTVRLRVHLSCAPSRNGNKAHGVERGGECRVQVQHELPLAGRGDLVAEGLELEASRGYKIDAVVLDVRLVRGRCNGHQAAVGADGGLLVDEGDALRSVRRRLWGLEGPSGLERILGVQQASGDDPALKEVALLDAVEEHLFHLLHGQLRPVHPQQGGDAADMGRGHGGAAQVLVLVPGRRREDLAAGRSDVHRGVAEA
mmetsp:Transcript_35223/g.101430  ORF Transcript_35223/g.101430 Transcript_35223/m.101430 type:complete len:253 (+) Transcript_35223:1177-1935(+)